MSKIVILETILAASCRVGNKRCRPSKEYVAQMYSMGFVNLSFISYSHRIRFVGFTDLLPCC